MESTLIGGAFALIGGVLGYVFSSLRDTKGSQRERWRALRERQIEALIAFIQASNDLNRARLGLNMTVLQIQMERGQGATNAARLEQQRQQDFVAIREAESRAKSHELNLRLLAPYLTEQVEELNLASRPKDHKTAEMDHSRREAALAALFEAARERLELHDHDLGAAPSLMQWASRNLK